MKSSRGTNLNINRNELLLNMKQVAVLMTVFNRLEKTIQCLNTLFESLQNYPALKVDVFLTDDGSGDHTSSVLKEMYNGYSLYLLQGDGNLYWNGGMNYSWKAALEHGKYDGYLWLNNDTTVFSCLWRELLDADEYAQKTFGKKGIYVGSTCNTEGNLSYGGFNFVNRWTLKDVFLIPDGKNFQLCQCGHGNITYVSHDVVEKRGILCDGYWHGGGDHDYTYLAYKNGYPVFILREYVGLCENDHRVTDERIGLKKRIKQMNSILGSNLHNTLLFQRRCFPYRYPFAWLVGYIKVLFPGTYMKLYKVLRR